MKETLNNIQIIFTENDSGAALDILSFLKEKLGNTHVAQDAAVIIVSDEATADPEWQKEVRSLNPAVRLIPAGAIVNADYSDEKVIPKKIEELNFIRIDEDLHDNLYESLTIDADFYDIRNTVLVNRNSWVISDHSDSFLMPDYGMVKKCLRKVKEKAASETDEGFRQQLEEMQSYLETSRVYSRKIFMQTLRQRLSLGALAVVFGLMVYFGVTIISNLQRAARESALLGRDPSQAEIAENFVLLCDGINNSYIDGYTRGALYNEMTSYLDKPWPTTPTGLNYKYRLYDPHLLEKNEQYLMVMTENRTNLMFDTYTGKIEAVLGKANTDLKAYYVDSLNRCIFIVRNDNHILFGDPDTNQYLTHEVEYPFTGNTDIRIRTTEGYATIFDDKCEFVFETGGNYRPVSYLIPEVFRTDDYTIHDIRMFENEGTMAIEIEGEMNFLITSYESGEMPGFNSGIKPKEGVTASVYRNTMAFADEYGNIIILDREKQEVRNAGLKLPDVRFITLMSDDVLVYNDAVTGTHLYDFRNGTDLGEVLSGFRDLEYLGAGKYFVFCYADGAYHSQQVNRMMPQSEIDETAVLRRFSGTEPADEGYLYNVRYGDDHYVHYDMDVYETKDPVRTSYILDGSGMVFAGSAISDPSATVPEGTKSFFKEPLTYTGEVTVIGLIDNGFGMVIGTSDGHFREFTFDYDGSWLEDASLVLPNHAAVTEILECEDRYWIKDAEGNYWYSRKNYPVHGENPGLALDLMNDKLKIHGYFPQELLDSIDPQTVKDMGLQVLPGSDGKEWE